MLISDAYRAANARLHDALPYYGSYGGRHAEQVRALMFIERFAHDVESRFDQLGQ